jgi:hypothetical protein
MQVTGVPKMSPCTKYFIRGNVDVRVRGPGSRPSRPARTTARYARVVLLTVWKNNCSYIYINKLLYSLPKMYTLWMLITHI